MVRLSLIAVLGIVVCTAFSIADSAAPAISLQNRDFFRVHDSNPANGIDRVRRQGYTEENLTATSDPLIDDDTGDNITSSSREILYKLNFRDEFARWNPYPQLANPSDNSSDFVWIQGGGRVIDQGMLLNNTEGGIDIVNMPFHYYAEPDFLKPGAAGAEAAINYVRTPFTVNDSQVLTVHHKFNVQLFNLKHHNFPAEEMVNADDDPRLGQGGTTLLTSTREWFFYIFATNNGVWGVYERYFYNRLSANNSNTAFMIVKRFADRVDTDDSESRKAPIHSALQYDGKRNVVNYFLDGILLWTVGNFGIIPDDFFGGVLVHQKAGPMPTVAARPDNFVISFYTHQFLNWHDPNTKEKRYINQPLRGLVKTEFQPDASINGSTWWDPLQKRYNIIRGGGCILTLEKVSIVRQNLQNNNNSLVV